MAGLAPTIPSTEPLQFVAGNAWNWDRALGDFLASDGWELSYRFVGESELSAAWATEVTANGDVFEVRVPGTATAAIKPGPYRLIGTVTHATETASPSTPVDIIVDIKENPATIGTGVSANKQMLDAIEDCLAGRALTSDKRSLSINGRSIEYASVDELVKAKAHFEILYTLERNPELRVQHAVRFVNA